MARSRRSWELRWLNDFGIRSRSIASTGVGKSTTDSRLTCRSSVSTTGRGVLAAGLQAGIEDDGKAGPRVRPASAMTSPGFSSVERLGGRRPAQCRGVAGHAASRSDSWRRRPAYSSKSPRWQVIDSR